MIEVMTGLQPPPADTPAAQVVLRQSQGLGVPSAQPLDPFGVRARRQRQHRAIGRQWFSPLGYYLGPFRGPDALSGADEFFHRTNLYRKPPQIYLTATESGVGIIPTSTWMMRRARGAPRVLWITYDALEAVELSPATLPRMSVVTPRTSSKLGQVVLVTTDSRTATLSGTTVDGLSAFLQSLGARLEP
jgi:hypothetical protein